MNDRQQQIDANLFDEYTVFEQNDDQRVQTPSDFDAPMSAETLCDKIKEIIDAVPTMPQQNQQILFELITRPNDSSEASERTDSSYYSEEESEAEWSGLITARGGMYDQRQQERERMSIANLAFPKEALTMWLTCMLEAAPTMQPTEFLALKRIVCGYFEATADDTDFGSVSTDHITAQLSKPGDVQRRETTTVVNDEATEDDTDFGSVSTDHITAQLSKPGDVQKREMTTIDILAEDWAVKSDSSTQNKVPRTEHGQGKTDKSKCK